MTKDFEARIDNYERSVRRLRRLTDMESATESALHEVDQAVSEAFDALLEADIETTHSLLERIDYLLKLVRARNPDDDILQRLVDTIWRDIVQLQVRRLH